MGGTSSQPVVAQTEGDQEGIFSLSAEMQQQLANDFHNEQIIKLFGKQMEKIGERKAALLHGTLEQRAQIDQHMAAFRQQNQKVQSQLDTAIEKLEDRFADTANILEYDMTQLEQKHLGGSNYDTNKLVCLMERTDIATCYQQNKNNPLACDPFVMALTKCVEKTITGSS
jgi:hypothetical protein